VKAVPEVGGRVRIVAAIGDTEEDAAAHLSALFHHRVAFAIAALPNTDD
jgi:hypothetical protein